MINPTSAPHRAQSGSSPDVCSLRELLAQDRLARAVGVGDALGAFLATRHGFDSVWASGLSISAAHGVPDASILTMTELLAAARIIERTTPLPLLADCDSGFGGLPNVVHMVEEYERAGIDGVCFEDKPFPKRNSFVPGQELVGADEFARKITAAKRAQSSSDFVIVARTEALIVGLPMDEALDRANRYQDAGADAVLVHSKQDAPDEILAFAERWHRTPGQVPLVAVPTTYHRVTVDQLASVGISMAIYANHAVRAAARAIDDVFREMAAGQSTEHIESTIAPVSEVLELIGMGEIYELDAR